MSKRDKRSIVVNVNVSYDVETRDATVTFWRSVGRIEIKDFFGSETTTYSLERKRYLNVTRASIARIFDMMERRDNMLMWLADKDEKLSEIIDAGIKHYMEKYGKTPNVCYVHRTRKEEIIGDVRVVPAPFVHGKRLYFFGDEGEENE